ncbi:MAG: hypothetical protein ABSA47_09455 [Verrucomicrobiota bacterium]|jgi:hypothetical protein
MAPPTPPADSANRPSAPEPDANQPRRARALRIAFCAMVMLLAVFQFSENTADPDLWGHIVFGQQMLQTRAIPTTEIYSWTAQGQPWINHEWLAELALGGAHALLGGGGVLLLKMAVGLLTFALCLRLGGAGLPWPARYVVWGFGALAVVEISFGFAARPQIFTALALAVELLLLRRLHAGSRLSAAALPVLFVVWINTHGGALAGFGLLGLAALAATAQVLRHKAPRSALWLFWLAFAAVLAALFCNPWGAQLLRWLVGSVLWMRPEIQEWNPTPLGWDHAAFFFLIALAGLAWVFTRRPRAWWELAACAAFALLALRSVRNAPLCALVLLALVPPHLADVLARFRRHFARWEILASQSAPQNAAAVLCALAACAMGAAAFTLHKQHPLTMEAPRSQYPLAAVRFMRTNALAGRLLVFFDWGEMAIFSLPDCPPSIDGRLDTCYSTNLIAAHFHFYSGEPFDQKILDPNQADLALLPVNLAGAADLAKRPGWKPAYFDDVAEVLVRDPARFPNLRNLALPVSGPAAAQIRDPFPDFNPRWKSN